MSKVKKIVGGIAKVGKGSFPRFNYQCNERYKKNYNKIFKKENK